jgi:transposase
MVQETLVPGASVAIIARRHGVNANQLFSWRRQYRRGVLELVNAPASEESALVAIAMAPMEAPQEGRADVAHESQNGGRIDIEFQGGRRVSVWGQADLETLGAILREFSRT